VYKSILENIKRYNWVLKANNWNNSSDLTFFFTSNIRDVITDSDEMWDAIKAFADEIMKTFRGENVEK
jgi:hypothetical protein